MKDAELFGKVRTGNPAAITHDLPAPVSVDDLGRVVMTPYQVRDLVFTAQAQTATLAEVSLFAGASGFLHDLVYLVAANTTGAVVQLSIRDNLAGGIVETLQVPANGTEILHPSIPIPQNEASNSWTIQNAGSGDISATNVIVSALFIRNV